MREAILVVAIIGTPVAIVVLLGLQVYAAVVATRYSKRRQPR